MSTNRGQRGSESSGEGSTPRGSESKNSGGSTRKGGNSNENANRNNSDGYTASRDSGKTPRDMFVPTYHVELLFDKIPTFNAEIILAEMQKVCGFTRIEANTEDFLVFAFEDYAMEQKDRNDCPQCVIVKKDHSVDKAKIKAAIEQTWDWPDKESIIRKCKHKVVFADFLSSEIEYTTRLKLFNNALTAVLKSVSCIAINWVNSVKLVSPDIFTDALNSEEAPDYLYGALNVRLFNVVGQEGEFVMDTLGLGAFGLPDLQCHFKGLSPEDVAGVLINYGYYIFEKGDVISDGHTIQGINEEHKWMCTHVASINEPIRKVIDLNPGKPYGAE